MIQRLAGVSRVRLPASRRLAVLAVVVGAMSASFLIAAPTASAYTYIDQYHNCILRAYVPTQYGSSYYPSGEIDCNQNLGMYLQVCADVYNSGTWYVITNSCVPNDNQAQFFYGTTTGVYGKWEAGVCGHVYRTGDFGNDSSNGYLGAGYQSSSETQCS